MDAIRFEFSVEDAIIDNDAILAIEDSSTPGMVYAYVRPADARQFVAETDADVNVLTDYIELQLTDADVEAADFAESTEHLDALREMFGAFEIWGAGETLDVVLI